jgi:hypothetical protein
MLQSLAENQVGKRGSLRPPPPQTQHNQPTPKT